MAAWLRFATLGERSFWRDEIVTLGLVRKSFGSMLATIPKSESTPPLYYCVTWAWVRIFGSSEAGIRSFSALVGVLTALAVYGAGTVLVSRRVGIAAAAVTAVSPPVVWYSQEARSYALLVLLSVLSFLFFARALDDRGRPRTLALWSIASCLALATHYFAGFLILSEMLWLAARIHGARRRVAFAITPVVVVAAALLPLAIHQRHHPGWIATTSLVRRLGQVPAQFLVGPQPSVQFVAALLLVPASLALWLGVIRGDRRERRAIFISLAVAAPVIGLPFLLIPAIDVFLAENLSPALVPVVVAVGAGVASSRAGKSGFALGAAVIAIGVGVDLATAREPMYGTDDWRGAAHAVGAGGHVTRALVLTPAEGGAEASLRHYLPSARPMPPGGASVGEIVVIALPSGEHGIFESPQPPAPQPSAAGIAGFRRIAARRNATFTLVRYLAETRKWVTSAELSRVSLGGAPLVFVEPG